MWRGSNSSPDLEVSVRSERHVHARCCVKPPRCRCCLRRALTALPWTCAQILMHAGTEGLMVRDVIRKATELRMADWADNKGKKSHVGSIINKEKDFVHIGGWKCVLLPKRRIPTLQGVASVLLNVPTNHPWSLTTAVGQQSIAAIALCLMVAWPMHRS